MKSFYTVALVLLLLAPQGCKSDDEANLAPIDQLPPITMTGENPAGCLVNGEVLVPKGNPNNSPILRCQYAFREGRYSFGLFITDKSNQISKSVGLVYYDDKPLTEKSSFNLSIESEDSNWGQYVLNGGLVDGFATNEQNTGTLSIDFLDEENLIISGTFSFTAVNNKGETIEVTDGRFDMNYRP